MPPATSFQKHRSGIVHDYVAFDIETLDVAPGSKIIGLGAVRVRDGREVAQLELLPGGWLLDEIPRGHPTDRATLRAMHRDSQQLARTIAECLEELAAFMGDDVLVGQNIASFDLKRIGTWRTQLNMHPLGNEYVDLLPLARRTYPDLPNHKLETLARHHGLGTVVHTALADALQEHQLYEKIKQDAPAAHATPAAPSWRKNSPPPIELAIAAVTEVTETPLSGAHICVTGEFPPLTRAQVWAKMAAQGVVPVAYITRETDYVLAGAGAGLKKLQLAAERGVPVLSGREYKRMQTGA